MGMNDTPSGERIHIGFFGRRNAGKSSVVNAVTGQELAVVSDVKGTTTDPVMKAMELLPMGPVMIIDTPGIDDEGMLGEKRVRKTKQILNSVDVAVLITDATQPLEDSDRQLLRLFEEKKLPYVVVRNKIDLPEADPAAELAELPEGAKVCPVSAVTGEGVFELKETIAHLVGTGGEERRIVGDLVKPGDVVILVVPIDSAAPKGRLILPQQQTIRDLLEADACVMVVKETELKETFDKLKERPAMVITDSQVFKRVSEETPEDVPLTSFSILMSRYKGFLEAAVHGVAAIEKLKPEDKVLISEGCTHHRQCDDIGTVKIPRWLNSYLGFPVQIETTSGREFPEDVSEYALVIHCGGCMLTEREMTYRMKCAGDQDVPFTNYGICIAYMQGILKRCLGIFPQLLKELED